MSKLPLWVKEQLETQKQIKAYIEIKNPDQLYRALISITNIITDRIN